MPQGVGLGGGLPPNGRSKTPRCDANQLLWATFSDIYFCISFLIAVGDFGIHSGTVLDFLCFLHHTFEHENCIGFASVLVWIFK